MGVFGYGPLDGDDAMSVLEQWDDRVKTRGMKPGDAVAELLKEWGDPVDSGREVEVIALVGVCLRDGVPVGEELKKAGVRAINGQLSPQVVEEWDDPPARRKALLALLKKVGGERKKVKATAGFKHPQIQFRDLDEARDVLLRLQDFSNKYGDLLLFMISKGWIDEDDEEVPEKEQAVIQRIYPEFMKKLRALLLEGIGEESARIRDHAFLERILMCAAFVGMKMRLEKEELSKILDRCISPPFPEE